LIGCAPVPAIGYIIARVAKNVLQQVLAASASLGSKARA
jgi:hypothetical protein